SGARAAAAIATFFSSQFINWIISSDFIRSRFFEAGFRLSVWRNSFAGRIILLLYLPLFESAAFLSTLSSSCARLACRIGYARNRGDQGQPVATRVKSKWKS